METFNENVENMPIKATKEYISQLDDKIKRLKGIIEQQKKVKNITELSLMFTILKMIMKYLEY